MKPADLLELLTACYRDKLAQVARHEAHAWQISEYDFNNTYQYILAREDMHLAWIRAAVEELGHAAPERAASIATPTSRGRRKESESAALLRQDAQEAQAFVDRWRPKVEVMSHIRNQGMLRVVLGETLEQKRFFDQAVAGRTDLLGRRMDGAGTGGGVLPTRWLE